MNRHCEGTLGIIRGSTSPLNGARSIRGIATRPGSKFDLHWSLWVLICVCSGGPKYSHDRSPNRPYDLICGPFDCVCDELILIAGRWVELASIVCGCIPFAKIVCLYICIIGAEPLHVNFVKVVRLQDKCADDARARSTLHSNRDLPEHDVKKTYEGR